MGNQCSCWSQSKREIIMEVDVPQRESEENIKAIKTVERNDSFTRPNKEPHLFMTEECLMQTFVTKPALIKNAENEQRIEQTLVDFDDLEEEKKPVFASIVNPKVIERFIKSPSASGRQTPRSSRKNSHISERIDQIKKQKLIEPYKPCITFFGESGVGKTSFIYKICYNQFDLYHIPTISTEQIVYDTKHEGASYQVNFIDTCGLPEYKSELDELTLSADFLIYVVDLTDSRSFLYVKKLLDNQSTGKVKTDCLERIILGNKIDLASRCKGLKESVKLYAEASQIPFFEVSAKTNFNLVKFMKHCLETFYHRNSN